METRRHWKTVHDMRERRQSMEVINSTVPFGLIEVPSRIKRVSAGMTVEAGTNGYQGGDHGCITYIRIQAGTRNAVSLSALDQDGEEEAATRCAGFDFSVEGDLELDDCIRALEFAAEVLKEQRGRDEAYGDY